MTPAERRTALVRLISEIDQKLAEVEALAADDLLVAEERLRAVTWAIFQRRAAGNAERVLRKLEAQS